ncbi:MAG: sigma 54-interacting transcriptional regulator, partial [Candidatus Tectomicrobia bacterium]|nr:sigma 54-interacting transcriptional regulator [Candidatus Tectomicrobia bacterium]
GYRREEVVGKLCRIMEGPNCKGFSTVADLLESPNPPPEGICNQECKVLTRDGRELYLHGNVRVLTDPDGVIVGAVGTFTDLTSFIQANEKIALLEEQTKNRHAFQRLVGKSAPMQEVFRRLRLASQSDVTVLITGASGTGKELAAQAVHALSARHDKPFLSINCGAIPETLLESELFGHVRGAFTGAVRDKTGIFEAADGGTLLLDEIGDVSPLLQLKLLRVLQEQEVQRIGATRPRKVDVRLIGATNKDLAALVQDGTLRDDFYYRVHVFEITLPPLRERREDIPLLVEHFIREVAQGTHKSVTGIARDALQRLMDYPWPGNIRELRNAIEHAFVTVQGENLTLLDLPVEIRQPTAPPGPSVVSSRTAVTDSTERQRILDALRQVGGSRTEAAKILGFSRVTLWKKMRQFKIDAHDMEAC